MSAVISVDNLTVRYGRKTALAAVSLEVKQGGVYALLGRNGAGKSSLVRCLLGLQKPTTGTIRLFERDVWRERRPLMEKIGIVGEESDAPPDMTVAHIADFSSRLYTKWNQQTVDERLRRFAIDRHAKYGDLSKGQKKQVALAMALAMSPEMLVLDDPTLGLDVVARKSLFEEVIAELADRGITIMITTHDLAGVEAIADRVGILRDGRLVLDEEVEAIKGRFRRLRIVSPEPVAFETGNLIPASVRRWGSGTEAVVSNYDELAFERFRNAANASVETSPMSLEEIFIAVTGEEGTQS